MDICEISNPKCIATCSLDRKIVIYSLKDNNCLRVIDNSHYKGVKRLSYCSLFGGLLVSIGYEVVAKVWSPESLISDNLLGNLKGHSRPLIDTKFIGTSPFNVTVDQSNEIRIWDLKSFSCLQVFKSRINTAAQGILCLDNSTIWIYGKRFIQFDTFSVDEDGQAALGTVLPTQKNAKNDIFPLWAEVNTYYHQIVIVNKNEVKLFDCSSGTLTKVHYNMAEPSQSREITQFKLDLRHRKCYVADTHGKVNVFNIQSGIPFKEVTEAEKDDDSFSQDGRSHSSKTSELSEESQKDEDIQEEPGEITGMNLIWEEDYIMMVCTDTKYYYVYDEEDTENSEMLRRVTGGNKDEITILQYNDHLSLIATGSIDGEVVVWDFELSKIEGICIGHQSDITGIEFIAQYPLMITASMDCTVCIWGVRPVPLGLRYICLHRYTNNSWSYKEDKETPISKIVVVLQSMESIQHDLMSATKFGAFDFNSLIKDIKNGKSIDPKSLKQESSFMITQIPPVMQLYNSDSENDSEVTERCYLYISDELGFIKIWEFTSVISQLAIKKAPLYRSTKINFTPKRKEIIDVTQIGSSMRKEAKLKKLPEIQDPEKSCIFIKEVKAHQECIVSMSRIKQEIGGFVTCSLDLRVRVWSDHLELWGTINSGIEKQDRKWRYPKDAKRKQKKEEIEQIKDLLVDVQDKVDPNRNLIFQDKKTFYDSVVKQEVSVARQESVPDKRDTLGELQSRERKKRRITDDSLHDKMIKRLDMGIREQELRMKLMQYQIDGQNAKKQYRGYAKYLQGELDSQSQTNLHNTAPLESVMVQGSKQQVISLIFLRDYIQTENLNTRRVSIMKNASGLIQLKKNYSKILYPKPQSFRDIPLTTQIARSRTNTKSRIGDTLERDRSCLFLKKDEPKLRNQISSFNEYASRRLFATPLKQIIITENEYDQPTDSKFKIDSSRASILPLLKLPDMSGRHTSMGTVSKMIDSRSRNSPRSVMRGRLNPEASQKLIAHDYSTLSIKPLVQPLPSTKSLVRHIPKKNYITLANEAYHIEQDSIMTEEESFSQATMDYRKRREKYLGQNSSIRLLVREEKEKLRMQRLTLQQTMPIKRIN